MVLWTAVVSKQFSKQLCTMDEIKTRLSKELFFGILANVLNCPCIQLDRYTEFKLVAQWMCGISLDLWS